MSGQFTLNTTQKYCSLVLLTALSLWGQGYGFGLTSDDHTVWLPLIDFFNHPQLFPRDVFIHSAANGYFPFWQGLAYLVRIFPPAPLFFVLHIAIRLLIFLFLWQLAKTFGLSDSAALISLGLLTSSKGFLAGFVLYSTSLTHSYFTWLLLIISLAGFFQDNYLLAFIFLGLGFNFNPPLGAQLFLIYALYLSLHQESWGERKLWLGIGLCLLFFLPATAHVFSPQPPVNKLLLWSLIKVRIKHHLFPFSWPYENWVAFFNVLLLLFLSLPGMKQTSLRQKVTAFLGGFALLAGAGIIFTEYSPQFFMIQLIPFRSHKFLVFLTFLLAGGYFEQILSAAESRLRPWEKILALLSWALLLIYLSPQALLGLVLFLLLSWQLFRLSAGFCWPRMLNVALGAIIIFLMFSQPDSLEVINLEIHSFTWQQGLIWLLLLGCLFFYAFGKGAREKPPRALTLLLLAAFFSSLYAYSQQPPTPAYTPDWVNLQKWAKNNTTAASLFLTPPEMELDNFRVLSQRSSFFNWKDITSLLWRPQLADYWLLIIKDYVKDSPKINDEEILDEYLARIYTGFTEDKFAFLGQKYGIDYAITKTSQRLRLPIVYRNQSFIVYQLANQPALAKE